MPEQWAMVAEWLTYGLALFFSGKIIVPKFKS
jgi:hypothetical protein